MQPREEDFMALAAVTRALGATSALAILVGTAQPVWAAPDLIVLNGDVRTVDQGKPKAQAFAIENGKFTAVGSNDEIKALADAETKVIDAGGVFLIGAADAVLRALLGQLVAGVDRQIAFDVAAGGDRLAALRLGFAVLVAGFHAAAEFVDAAGVIETAADLGLLGV